LKLRAITIAKGFVCREEDQMARERIAETIVDAKAAMKKALLDVVRHALGEQVGREWSIDGTIMVAGIMETAIDESAREIREAITEMLSYI
jgi:alcohol dehydrogenase class IV